MSEASEILVNLYSHGSWVVNGSIYLLEAEEGKAPKDPHHTAAHLEDESIQIPNTTCLGLP